MPKLARLRFSPPRESGFTIPVKLVSPDRPLVLGVDGNWFRQALAKALPYCVEVPPKLWATLRGQPRILKAIGKRVASSVIEWVRILSDVHH